MYDIDFNFAQSNIHFVTPKSSVIRTVAESSILAEK
jgi:hypothetical protein